MLTPGNSKVMDWSAGLVFECPLPQLNALTQSWTKIDPHLLVLSWRLGSNSTAKGSEMKKNKRKGRAGLFAGQHILIDLIDENVG